MMKIKPILMGVVARLINPFIKVRPKTWVFGSDQGQTYREGAKYLLEYVQRYHPDYKCIFVTQNPLVVEELNAKGINCLMNFSWRAIFEVAKAEAIFTTQSTADVKFTYKKPGRKFFYMMHGMSQKISWKQLPAGYIHSLFGEKKFISVAREKISQFLTIGYTVSDVEFLSSTSEFFIPYIHLDFGDEMEVQTLGMPRNDALFQPERMRNEKWIGNTSDKLVVTYMPTHRKYGAGEITPTPFADNPEVQNWMRQNNVLFVMKNHPNFISRIKQGNTNDVLKDVTADRLDPQVCIYHSDVLITDFSSVWVDYLLLQRPLIFYFYDDFEKEDVGSYFDIKKEIPGHFCYNEDQLFELIKQCKQNYDAMRPSDSTVHKFQKFVDGDSCERYFNEVIKHFGR